EPPASTPQHSVEVDEDATAEVPVAAALAALPAEGRDAEQASAPADRSREGLAHDGLPDQGPAAATSPGADGIGLSGSDASSADDGERDAEPSGGGERGADRTGDGERDEEPTHHSEPDEEPTDGSERDSDATGLIATDQVEDEPAV